MNESSVNNLNTDFRVEVIAAEILGQSGDLGNIIIRRKQSVERPHTKDIQRISNDYSSYDMSLLWLMETSREGLYETMPENLFHEPTLGHIHSSETEILGRIRRQREEEIQARSFFSPFEQELSYLNVSMYALEKEICRTSSDDIIHIFARSWPFLEEIDAYSARVFIHILPFLHRVKGDFRWMEAYISLFTGLPVQIAEYPRLVMPADRCDCYTLGQQVMGEQMLLHGPAYDGETDIEIVIGPVPWDKMKEYLPGSSFNRILDELYQHFIPFSKNYRQRVFAAEEQRCFVLDEAEHNALGYSIYL